MKLSIITVNLNNAKGLRHTMESVVNQSYSQFEYIIIDGASEDDSVQVAESIIEQRKEFSVLLLSEKDSGIFNAMNKGIQRCSGDYILFLNSGDYLVNSDVLLSVFDSDHTADILCAKCDCSKNGVVVWTSAPPKHITFGTLFLQGISHQSTFIRRNLFDKVGLYDESYKYNADIEFWYRAIILNNATTETIDIVTTNYNLEGISETAKESQVFIEEHHRILSHELFQHFIPDYEQWKTDRNFVANYYWILKHPHLMRALSAYDKISRKCNKIR